MNETLLKRKKAPGRPPPSHTFILLLKYVFFFRCATSETKSTPVPIQKQGNEVEVRAAAILVLLWCRANFPVQGLPVARA